MRWSNLTLEAEETAHLPGYRDEAVVRHFDAPDSIATRFYEIRARSILNRVPEASQMPFRWTINPYRGCTHACTYCASGQTPVLLADGRHKPLAELEVGEAIYGTARGPSGYRRYTPTTVLDKWITIKSAFRVTLADDTELIVSPDHRLLTDRGFKYVRNTPSALADRPYLTLNNHLVGTGRFAPQPSHNAPYRRGYLCGMVRGDALLRRYRYPRTGGSDSVIHSFRLALADQQALVRTREFLTMEGVETDTRVFAHATDPHREMRAIYSGRRSVYEQVGELIEWPLLPRIDWLCGFLAGIYDAEGSRHGSALRISNSDPQLLAWIDAAATRLGFKTIYERGGERVPVIRITGGLSEHLRFFHLTDPAITRKRTIDGQMVKTLADLSITSIAPLGTDLPLYDLTTGTGDFVADGVVHHNCFARPTHTYLDFDAGRDFEREIVVKVNAPERLRAELARPSWKGEHIALGTNTDPYQWVEGRYKLMRGIWEVMIAARNPSSVLTKSPLLLRDLDLMRELNDVTEFTAALSVPTIDERAWRATEPHTPSPRARLEAVAELNRAGIRTGILVAPLMPGINDDPEQIAEILKLADEAGAVFVRGIGLHLRGEVRQVFMQWLQANRPDLVGRYRQLYRRGAYAPVQERRRLARLLERAQIRPAESARWSFETRPSEALAEPEQAVPEPEQASLF
jgi:DNA repair photolyase